jgi:two-component system response regulator RegA
MMPSVLLVDHDDGCRDSLSRVLRERGFAVTAAATAEGGLAAAERQPPDFAVVDTGVPDGTRVDLIAALGPVSPRTKLVFMNRAGSIAAAVKAVQRSLARAVWEHMQRVLADCDGNVSAAARRLGIARRTLQLKLKKYPPRN